MGDELSFKHLRMDEQKLGNPFTVLETICMLSWLI